VPEPRSWYMSHCSAVQMPLWKALLRCGSKVMHKFTVLYHTIQSVNSLATVSAVHIQIPDFKFEGGICWLDHLEERYLQLY